ncbi:hypothetical protein [Congregicoccus parvus]|uniref:hypothetical protein n=1 Tax=Congregicoccus parvus TaxID=3081749 RepID=UPI003FA5B224
MPYSSIVVTAPHLPPDLPGVKRVASFLELVSTPFADGVNALCWARPLEGDFAEVVACLGHHETEMDALDETRLLALPVGPAGRIAVERLVADLRLLREHGLEPVLDLIHAYPRDESPGPVATDVYSFHADSAPIEADTWLCTYHGPASEGVPNSDVRRRVDDPATRAALLALHDGPDDAAFEEFLRDNCYDLHYAAAPDARVFSFGLGALWRIAVAHPAARVPPCIHRAPAQPLGLPPRLLLIS